MIEDCFDKWFEINFKDKVDSFTRYNLRQAYYAGWIRHMNLVDAIEGLQSLSQDFE